MVLYYQHMNTICFARTDMLQPIVRFFAHFFEGFFTVVVAHQIVFSLRSQENEWVT